MEHDSAGSGRRRPAWLRPDLGLGRNNGLLFWAYLVWGAGFTIQIALWTIFIESLGATPAQIGLVVGGGAVVRTLLAIPAGSLADRFPLKPVMVGMMGIPILGAAGLVVATEWWHALAGAVLMDLSAVSIPATSAYIAASAKPEERTRAMTYIFNISGLLTMIVAPAIGGWLAQEAGFRAVYIVGAILFAGGIAIMTLIDDVKPAAESSDGDAADPSLGYRDLLRLPGIWVILGFHLAVPLFAFTGVALLPNFLKDERGLSVATIGVLASLGSIAAFGASLLVSHWRPLTRPFLGMAFTLTVMSVAMALFLAFAALPVMALAYMLRVSFSPVWSLMASAVAEVTPERLRGRAYGLAEFAIGIGDSSAPIAAGGLYGIDHRLPLGLGLLTTLPLAVASLVAHRLRGRFIAEPAAESVPASAIVAGSNPDA